MVVLVIVLSVILACVGISYGLQVRESRKLAEQLKRMNDEQRTQIVTMSYPTGTSRNLLAEVNRLIFGIEKREQSCRSVERQLQELVSNVSHDLRTPLTAILGYIRLINSGKVGGEEAQRYLGIIERRATTLQELIMAFYDISRLNENSYVLRPEPTDVTAGLCTEVIAELYDELTADGAAILADMSYHKRIMIDPKALKRVYENLLQNAKKHGSGNIRIADGIEDGELVLSISNECAYMDDEKIKNVFDRAYSADHRGGNTGFGLSISKALIEKMGHKIKASYNDGEFTVQINFNIQGEL